MSKPTTKSTLTKRLFHGTDVNFQPGALVLPGNLIGRRNHQLSKDGRVYLTTDPNIAMIFAKDFMRKGQKPRVYEVKPIEPKQSEPHIPDSHEWVARRAEIVRRIM
jgi:hypothetical protein